MNSAGRTLSPLERRAAEEGKAWAEEVRAEIHGEQRAAAGGWPGTMSEARSRLVASVLSRSGASNGSSLATEERERAARVLYASARSAWLSRCDREESCP